MKELARCTGHCCKAFFLPHTKEVLLERAAEYRKYDPELKMFNTREWTQVSEMAIPLGTAKDLSPELRAMFPESALRDEEAQYFTCKNHDAETGNCKVYATRPAMCSDYPYGGICKYNGCTMRVERPEPLKRKEELGLVEEKQAEGSCSSGGCGVKCSGSGRSDPSAGKAKKAKEKRVGEGRSDRR